MKYASDFRTIARNALRGKWKIAVLAGLIALLLGAVSAKGPELELNVEGNVTQLDLQIAGQQISSMTSELPPELSAFIVGAAGYATIVTIVVSIVFLVLGGIIGVGYSKFNLDLLDGEKELEINTLFEYFTNWKTITIAKLLRRIYVFLGTLLFIIPGIFISYSYAMISYILAENPELSAREAMKQSEEMMEGNRWRLFCLEFSFIGWEILCLFTLGIGNLWLTPYIQAARAAFYREVSGTEALKDESIE